MSSLPLVLHPYDILQPSTSTPYDVNEVKISFEQRAVTFQRSVVSGTVFIPLNDVIPCAGLLTCTAHQKSNYGIRIISLTAVLKPKGPVKIEEVLGFALTVQPPPASDWAALVLGAVGSPVFPTSVVHRTIGESAIIAPINITAGSTLADIRRALTSSHLLNRQCTNHVVLQLANTFIAPEPISIIAPPIQQRIPVDMQIGLDAARLQREYMQLRIQTDRTLKEGFINVPLFRRIRSASSSHDQFTMTIFGFWIQYLMDVSKGARPELLTENGKITPFVPRPDKDHNELLPQCEIGSSSEEHTLYNSHVTVPRMLVVDLYTHLLAPACNDATSRFHDTDNGLNVCFRQPGNAALQDATVTFNLVYEHVIITTSNSAALEPFSFLDDFSNTANPTTFAW